MGTHFSCRTNRLSKRETEQRTPVVDEKWIGDITTQAVNKCLAQLSGATESESDSTEANGMEVTSQASTWATVAGTNNASQTKAIVANIREIMKEQSRAEAKRRQRAEHYNLQTEAARPLLRC